MAQTPDVAIRGAGPVGCALALALRDSGLAVVLQERSGPPPGFRPLALSYASRLILERLGAWPALEATPIDAVLVSQHGGFGRSRLSAADAGVPALGYVVEYGALLSSLRSRAIQSGIPMAPELPGAARCVVHAEGSADDASEKRYAQDALVAAVETVPGASATAYERFTPAGPLALLPLAGRFAAIWSLPRLEAERLAAAPDREFLAALGRACGSRIGRPVSVGARSVQPLVLRVRVPRIAERAVYIGNAAQTLHPVAGQGLNLGLRDAWELARHWRGASDPGDATVLRRYAERRRLDAAGAIRATDVLATAFLGTGAALRAVRGLGLAALDVLPGPRRFFARRMIFGPSAMP